MILQKNGDTASPIEKKLMLIAQQLDGLQAELLTFQEAIALGDIPSDSDATRLMTSCKNWIRLALEMEMKLNDRTQPNTAPDTNYAIDLAAARREIGCRMARVAKCCKTG